MGNLLKIGFVLLLLALNIFLFRRSHHNETLLQESFHQLANGTVSNVKPKNAVHSFYKDIAGSYEVELEERLHKKIDIDSMWNALSKALAGEDAPKEVVKYYPVKWSEAKSPTEKKIAEFTSVAKASDRLDSLLAFLKNNYLSPFRKSDQPLDKDLTKKYFDRSLEISKAHQDALWSYFQQYNESISALLEHSVLRRKAHLDSIWRELNQVAAKATPADLAAGRPFQSSLKWDFNYLWKPINIRQSDLNYLIPKMKPLVESNHLMILKNELAKLNSLFAGNGNFQLYGKTYLLGNVTPAEFHSILKKILLSKDLTDNALVSCYEESVGL